MAFFPIPLQPNLREMHLLIGIDDTDNKESRGTGFHARQLAKLIEERKLGEIFGITRHQLFVHPEIPYTSQNSSAALEVKTDQAKGIREACIEFLLEIAPEGCDIGLCIAETKKINEEIISWGQRAKKEVLSQTEAVHLANTEDIFLQGLTGSKDGIIGALAAVGLRKSGNDGRFVWLRGKKELRELPPGTMSVKQLKINLNIDKVESVTGEVLNGDINISLHDWVRPVLKSNAITLLVEKENRKEAGYEWKCASKDYVRTVS